MQKSVYRKDHCAQKARIDTGSQSLRAGSGFKCWLSHQALHIGSLWHAAQHSSADRLIFCFPSLSTISPSYSALRSIRQDRGGGGNFAEVPASLPLLPVDAPPLEPLTLEDVPLELLTTLISPCGILEMTLRATSSRLIAITSPTIAGQVRPSSVGCLLRWISFIFGI